MGSLRTLESGLLVTRDLVAGRHRKDAHGSHARSS